MFDGPAKMTQPATSTKEAKVPQSKFRDVPSLPPSSRPLDGATKGPASPAAFTSLYGFLADKPLAPVPPSDPTSGQKKKHHDPQAEKLPQAIDSRIKNLEAIGLDPDHSDMITPGRAVDLIKNGQGTFNNAASTYGIPPALLKGIVASEMSFDYTAVALGQDTIGNLPGNSGHAPGNGMGVGRVHQDSLETAVAYLKEHKLQGWEEATEFLKKEQDRELNPYQFNNSVTASAIVSAMYADAYKNSHDAAYGKPDGQANPTLTPDQMAVIWGAYRNGVEGISPKSDDYGFSQENFGRNVANGAEGLPTDFQMGKNAYMSQPFFEYFSGMPITVGSGSGGGGGGGGGGGF